MARYIDADALIDFIDVGHLRHPSELCFSEVDVVNMLNHAPSIEIVRCKDCDNYAGDGMYCASNHIVHDFSTSRGNCEPQTEREGE